eukprot:TRINITY_DN2891_c1_g1_i5.p2 TRINITY_DN2891_c1_g1~~TRINITY_DN2891_c1_g1_i5.p2  ORF type:complete len:352 (+),score=122.16 TRINITY_DN2891_c1_g1_i5:999-2054(+)
MKGAHTPGVVYTPWLPDGAVQNQLALEEELHHFAQFMTLSRYEHTQRSDFVQLLRDALGEVSPDSRLHDLTCYALCEPGSGMDLVVDVPANCEARPRVVDLFLHAAANRGAEGSVVGGAGAAVFLRMQQDQIYASVEFGTVDGDRLAAAETLSGWLAEFAALRVVYPCMRYVLDQSRLLGTDKGGLSPYALLVMILHSCRLCKATMPTSRTQDAAQVLYRFLLFFGEQLNPETQTVDSAGTVARRSHRGDPLSVADPMRPGANAAAGCTRIVQLRMHLSYCLSSLAQWDPNCSGRRRKYKGRTPLSSIINHGPLWVRQRWLADRFSEAAERLVSLVVQGGPEEAAAEAAQL